MPDYYESLRKAELHVHLEGSVEAATLLELDTSLQPEDVRDVYRYQNFAGFLQSYAWVSKKLREPEHYGLITQRLLEQLEAQNVSYAEINLSMGVVLWKEQDAEGIFQAEREAAAKSKVRVRWIFDAVRQFGYEHVERVAALALQHQEHDVVGFGIGGDEARGPARDFGAIFGEVRKRGMAIVPHAGESMGPESIWAALEMGAVRIGHGIRAIDDPVLMEHLRREDIPLEVCISSNICTGVVPTLEEHPVRKLFDAGVPVVLNSDDPAMFHTTLSNEYRIAAESFGFTEEELRGLAANSFRYALDSAEANVIDNHG